ncbi:MAG: S8 family peptidase [Magnetococcales bacterium]|nr:S8 family peptidase [Magnetococcales bacterium]
MMQDDRRHLELKGFARPESFLPPGGGGKAALPPVNRARHGHALLNQLSRLKEEAVPLLEEQHSHAILEPGLRLEFRSPPGIELAFESLARRQQGIEVLNVRREGERTFATVFVPERKLGHFETLVRDYLEKDTEPSKEHPEGHPKNQALVETIQEIRQAALLSLWTDSPELLPASEEEVISWEVWLPLRRKGEKALSHFQQLAGDLGFKVVPGILHFLERWVFLMRGSRGQMTRSMRLLNTIAELRRAKEGADFFDTLAPLEQGAWLDELRSRCHVTGGGNSPHICLLDTGVNRGHPLLQPVLRREDLHSVEPGWGTADEAGHGSGMAGLAVYGDLTEVLASRAPVFIDHRLESVKLLRRDGDNDGASYGWLTEEAVARPEIQAPYRPRVFAMAVTATDSRDRGRPSAWSAAIDGLAADIHNDARSPRLMVQAGGNVSDNGVWFHYPASNATDGIHDPGQAWNALTVGAYTEKTRVAPGYTAIAAEGALSPFSTTSLTWDKVWPLKPDVVFEGGNAAKDRSTAYTMADLSLLTTHYRPEERSFTTFEASSAATALAARMAAQLMAHYPDFWPETIRALMVHSAEWTPAMRDMLLVGSTDKQRYGHLLRHCGFGVPNVTRAMWSAGNSLTLVAQDTLQPFEKRNGSVSVRDMNLYDLPWPIDELQRLGATPVTMRVTLSYFIEPNPGVLGFRGPDRYASHGLRFQVRRPTETTKAFRARINKLAQDEEEGVRSGEKTDPDWILGSNLRHHGSLHGDIWQGEAAKLAQLGVLGVFPVSGWWKSRAFLKRYENKARYALIVSIQAPEVEVDLYNVVKQKILTEVYA